MYVAHGRMVLSPTDLVGHVACPHLTTLEREVALGTRRPLDDGDDAGATLIRRLGDAHEQTVLDEMRGTLEVVEIPRTDDPAAAELLTVDAMKRRADVVYQATFFDGRWRGHADFLVRNDARPSALGDWSYDVADTKLARHLKVGALLQMGVYAGRLEQLQGAPPESLTVILGSGDKVSVPNVDVAAYTRRTVGDFERWLDDAPTTYPVRVPHCAICPWAQHCQQQWRADDDLVLVPQMRRTQREHFREAGIGSVMQLAASTDEQLDGVGSVGDAAKRKLAAQARLQVAARTQA
ncbi:MAG: TM0106 family RecB-like putative nuclease, partial [Acidimicrobiales bacterium]